jgi:hypothetical protein
MIDTSNQFVRQWTGVDFAIPLESDSVRLDIDQKVFYNLIGWTLREDMESSWSHFGVCPVQNSSVSMGGQRA